MRAHREEEGNQAGKAEQLKLKAEELKEEIEELLWGPKTWLHEEQIVDDFLLYTILRGFCAHHNVEMWFDIRRCYRALGLSALPDLDILEPDQTYTHANPSSTTTVFASKYIYIYIYRTMSDMANKYTTTGRIRGEQGESAAVTGSQFGGTTQLGKTTLNTKKNLRRKAYGKGTN